MDGTTRTGNELPYFKFYKDATRFDIVLVVVSTLSSAIHGLAVPFAIYLFGEIVNNLVESSSHAIAKIIWQVLYIGIGIIFAAAAEVVCSTMLGERLAARVSTKYLAALLNQEIGFHDMHTRTGDILSLISRDMLLIQNAIGQKVAVCIHNLSIFIGGSILSISICWSMGLLGLTASPLLLCAGGIYMGFYSKYSAKAAEAYSEANWVAEQAFSQVRTVHSFVAELSTLSKISEHLNQATERAAATGLSKGLGLGITLAVSYFAWALQYWYGGTLVGKRLVRGGTVSALVTISLFSGKAIADCLQAFEIVVKGNAAAVRLFQVIERKSKIDSSSNVGDIPPTVHGRIELCNVSFAYPSRIDVPIFDNLSLEIPQGKTVALVGSSGSGKSSIVSLIERFYDPDKGEVRIDGKDIKKLQLKWLRRQIGLVSQEPVLFATSIKQNIQLGNPDSNEEEVISAAKVANAHSFISEFPEQYETQVGEKGIRLSGGQKQRIAIARAILKNPAIMLLDEATSALDRESEFLVKDALDNTMQDRTTVVIAHRLSTIKHADLIVVLDKGRVAETGTHEELMNCEGGMYAYLVQLQQTDQLEESGESSTDLQEQPIQKLWFASPLVQPCSKSDQASKHACQGQVKWFCSCYVQAWIPALVGNLGAVISGLLTAAFPLLFSNVIILFLLHRPEEAKIWVHAIVVLGVAIIFSSTIQYYYIHKCGARTTQEIQKLALTAIMKNEVAWFDSEKFNSSIITAQLASNSAIVRSVLSDTYSYSLQNVVAISAATVIAFICQWKMALLALATLPIQVTGNAVNHEFLSSGAKEDEHNLLGKAHRVLGEAASSIRTVHSFAAEERICSAFRDHLLEAKLKRFKRAAVAGSVYGISHGATSIANALLMWYGINQVIKGHFKVGPTMRAFTILSYTSYSCVELMRLIPEFYKGWHAIESMFSFANRKTNIEPDSSTGRKLKRVKGNLELANVSFSYPNRPQKRVLSCFNLSIRAGSTVALVGPSGSGKSSILALIQRFYDPTAGSILLDGYNIKLLNLRSMRQHIGYVQQEPALFATSVKKNILLGNETASQAEVEEAARLANAHELISSLPNAYDTQVGERGIQLSGGQRQRIAIARAILKKPAILLLDEATSALDVESERLVQEGINAAVERSRTTVIVAHRLSTVQHAEPIVVMESGSIVERGTHAELVRRGGAYAKMVSIEMATVLASS